MDKCDVLLHLCRLFRAVRSGEAARNAEGNHRAPRAGDSRSVGGNLTLDGDPGRHDLPLRGVKAEPESLAQHHLWSDLYADYPPDDVVGGVLYLLRHCRGYTHGTR